MTKYWQSKSQYSRWKLIDVVFSGLETSKMNYDEYIIYNYLRCFVYYGDCFLSVYPHILNKEVCFVDYTLQVFDWFVQIPQHQEVLDIGIIFGNNYWRLY